MHLHAYADEDTPAHMCTYLAQDSRPNLDPSQPMVFNPPRSLLAPAHPLSPCLSSSGPETQRSKEVKEACNAVRQNSKRGSSSIKELALVYLAP